MELAGELVGRRWVLARIGDDAVELDEHLREVSPHLAFDGEGRITGSSGVNRVLGGYELDGDELRLSGMASTRMAGPPAAMALEQRFLEALGAGGRVALEGDELRIGDLAFTRAGPS